MSADVVQAVREAMRTVSYPDAKKDVLASGLLKGVAVEGDTVLVSVQLPTMAVLPEVRDRFLRDVTAAAERAPGVARARVESTIKVVSMPPPADKNRVPGVKNIIAVASGKGGVGKSTVATNLALALQRWGARVGMLDADVFGPSLPQMLGSPTQPAGGTAEKRIAPALYHGMKVMSVAFFIEKADAVIWRGPMVHKLLTQFLEDADWGELDYLVVDLPPGTGDVQLSLSQLVPLHGAVMVTTPQEVAIIDVVKAMSMFKKVDVPVIGIVENMSYYACPACGHHDEIFARGGGRKLAESAGTTFLGEIPMDVKVRLGGDVGMPVVIGAPDSEHARIFMEIAASVAGRLAVSVLSGPRRASGLVTVR
jgi:ATP-binding protein involved in chromosome partitioning